MQYNPSWFHNIIHQQHATCNNHTSTFTLNPFIFTSDRQYGHRKDVHFISQHVRSQYVPGTRYQVPEYHTVVLTDGWANVRDTV